MVMTFVASDRELLEAYWAAQAQFGPFDIGPDEYLRSVREDKGTADSTVSEHSAIRSEKQ